VAHRAGRTLDAEAELEGAEPLREHALADRPLLGHEIDARELAPPALALGARVDDQSHGDTATRCGQTEAATEPSGERAPPTADGEATRAGAGGNRRSRASSLAQAAPRTTR
jgi:hypothetical protein